MQLWVRQLMVEENRCGSRKKAVGTHRDARPPLTQCVCVYVCVRARVCVATEGGQG